MARGRVLTVLFFHTLGPVLLGLMIMVLTGAIRIITKKAQGEEPGIEEDALSKLTGFLGADLESFAGVAIIVTILGLLGAWLCWRAMYISRKVARDYRVALGGQMIEQVASCPVEKSTLSLKQGLPGNISNIFLRGPLQTAVAARLVLTLVRPVVMILSFLVVLIVLSWKLTAILLPLLLLPLPLIYALNRSTHGASHRFYLGGGRKRFAGVLKSAVSEANLMQVSSPETGALVRKEYEENKEVNVALDDYDFSTLARPRSQFYTSIFQALLIGAGVFGFGLAAIRGWLSWEIIIGALIALKGVQQAVTVMWGMVASLVRKAPVVRNTQQFVDALKVLPDEDGVTQNSGSLKPSQQFLIASPVPAIRTTIPGWLKILRKSGHRFSLQSGECLLVSKSQPVPDGGTWISDESVSTQAKKCIETSNSQEWEQLPEEERLKALVLAGESENTRLIVLSGNAAKIPEIAEWILNRLPNVAILSVCRGWPLEASLDCFENVILHDGDEVIRSAPGADWEEYRDLLAEQLRQASSDFDDDDDDDDDDE